ncbi:sulfatase-like hydrolase/transferase [Janthinobacterium agaricidamnosum]|uniref:sulfatase-like hydrolase/transferase n=1 Tax=Janthinobacterium agaricidamnosum TaxID=55508 RepID=UPI003D331ACA
MRHRINYYPLIHSLTYHLSCFFGTPFVISPIEQRHVPMLIWMSDRFQDRLRLKRYCLDARRALPYSHDNVFHSILGLLGVSTSVYKPELDILNGCTNAE